MFANGLKAAAATFLGRMCLSGGVEKLPDGAWNLTREAIALYQKTAPLIKYGSSRRFGETGESWRHPRGWQVVVRSSTGMALVVIHTSADAPEEVSIPWPGDWSIAESFQNDTAVIREGQLRVKTGGDFKGSVFLIESR